MVERREQRMPRPQSEKQRDQASEDAQHNFNRTGLWRARNDNRGRDWCVWIWKAHRFAQYMRSMLNERKSVRVRRQSSKSRR